MWTVLDRNDVDMKLWHSFHILWSSLLVVALLKIIHTLSNIFNTVSSHDEGQH